MAAAPPPRAVLLCGSLAAGWSDEGLGWLSTPRAEAVEEPALPQRAEAGGRELPSRPTPSLPPPAQRSGVGWRGLGGRGAMPIFSRNRPAIEFGAWLRFSFRIRSLRMARVLEHFRSPGSQSTQGVSALAQGQLRGEQVCVRGQEQHLLSRAGAVFRRFAAFCPPARGTVVPTCTTTAVEGRFGRSWSSPSSRRVTSVEARFRGLEGLCCSEPWLGGVEYLSDSAE